MTKPERFLLLLTIAVDSINSASKSLDPSTLMQLRVIPHPKHHSHFGTEDSGTSARTQSDPWQNRIRWMGWKFWEMVCMTVLLAKKGSKPGNSFHIVHSSEQHKSLS